MLKKMWIWALLLLIPVPAVSAENIAFVHANVLSMDRNEILRDSTVLIQGDRITNLGSSSDVHLPDGCRVIDASGKYLMPGLIDAHVHMARKEELALFLLSGVTTVQGLGGYPPRSQKWLQEISQGNLMSPDYISCDTIAEQPYTADEVRTFVQKAASDGFTCIKLYSPPDWTQEAYAAFSDEAAKNKIRTVGHFPRNLDLKIAVNGLGSVAHAEEYLYTYFNKLPNRRDEATIPYAVQQTKEAGLGVIPNLVAYHMIGLQTAPDISQLMNAPGMENVLQIVRNTWAPEFNRYRKTFKEQDSQRLLSNYAFLQKLVLQMQKAGIPQATGTDTSSFMPFVLPGLSEQAEIKELVSAGFTPYEALTAATSGAARVVGLPDEIGRIAKGMRANLLLLSANPLEDVANTSHIDGVMIRGDWLNQDKMEQLKQQYKSWKDKWDDWMNSVLQSRDEAGARKALERAQSYSLEIDEESLNNLCYSLLQNTPTVPQGVSILRFNTIAFPQSANAFDSLGDAYAKSGETKQAIQSYEESLRLNKDNTHAREAIEQLKKSGDAGQTAGDLTLKVGQDAPLLNFTVFNSGQTATPSWADFENQVVILDFWASWCEPCVKSIPHMNALVNQFANKPVKFISITYEPQIMVREFVKKYSLNSMIGIDNDFAMFRSFKAWGIPMIVLIGRDKKVSGVIDPTVLTEGVITELLEERIPKLEQHPGWNDPEGAEKYFRSLLKKQ